MLGLRPRLKTRPSLLDLIQKKNIDEISASVAHAVPVLEADRVPLPASPLISPQRELPQPPPPRITLQEDSEEEDRKDRLAKMPPVSLSNV
jgi:V-type H+-transporting ATPase subunit A